MADSEQNFTDAVALFVRQYRTRYGITQPQVQQHARQNYGVNWSTGSISGLEAGRMALSVPVLLVIAATLSDLSGEQLSLGDLIGESERIELNQRLSISGEALSRFIGAVPVVLDREHGVEVEKSMEDMVAQIFHESRNNPSQITAQDTIDDYATIRDWPVSLSVERAAKKLGIIAEAMQLWSLRLWGQPLDDEVLQRAGGGATAQKRGHVTRQLMKEVQAALEAKDG